ncbi:hypothetical protein IPH92_00010 [Candidatus Kaiserbacteria bacterium]|nr:MAG: hypothetical protein IPH92_00010 [Candidatus Kaiserbacteria bacterium]
MNATGTNATTTNLRVTGTSALGTVGAGTWNGSAIGLAYGGMGVDVSGYSNGLFGLNGGTMTDIDTEAELETALGSLDVLTVTASDITSANLLSMLTDETGTGSVVFSNSPTFTGSAQFAGLRVTASSTLGFASSTALTVSGNTYLTGNVGIGTTTPSSLLTIDKSGFTGAGVAGIKQYLGFANSTLSALMYGDETYITNLPTATSTLVGKMIRIADTSALGNTVRGLEVQAYRGSNTKGENTGISGFGRTFGVRGSTLGDAGSTYLPAGVFAESEGSTQGNALRAYSGTMTTESLVYFFQDTTNFIGTGLKMDFGNAGGSFAATSTGKFMDLKVGGVSKFTIAANGSTTIGDGTVNAGLMIPRGGICVDSDGSCVSTTTGQIRSVTSALGNSDLAEMYFSNQALHAGEIVSLSGGLSVKRANGDTEEDIVGVVSTKPGMTLGFDDTSLTAGETAYPIGLKGRVPIKLSTENGPIKKGDRIALSSIPGVGMKADASSRVVGIALEDYDGVRAYSAGFLNQFGDDMLKERVIKKTKLDPRSQDGCYTGGGNALGEAVCVVQKVFTTTVMSENPEETRASMLAELTNETPEMATSAAGETLAVGQALMFIELSWYQVDRERMVLSELATTSPLFAGSDVTLWDSIKALASRFVDGVLSVTGIKADRIEVKDELCVDGVCVTADDLRAILQSTRSGGAGAPAESETGGGETGGGENNTGGEGSTGGSSEGDDSGEPSTPVAPVPQEPTPPTPEEPPVVEAPTPEAPIEQEPTPEPAATTISTE